MSEETRRIPETKSFQEALALYCEQRLAPDVSEEGQEFAAKVFYAGALGGIAVLANRLAAMPQTTDPSSVLPNISTEIEKATAELRNINFDIRGMRTDS